MGLKVDMDSWDYQEAIKQVQKLLDNIELIEAKGDGENGSIEGVPSASDCIK